MSRDQLDAFLAVAAKDRAWPLWLFLADTGCRPSEAMALQWEDVDLIARQARIHRALDEDRREKGTKTNNSRRVDLSTRLVAALDAHQVNAEAAALAKGRDVNVLVFPSSAGTPLDIDNLRRTFRGLLQRAGLPKLGGPYIARHTWASHMLAVGAPITYVSAQLGHASAAITLSVYAHFLPADSRGFADKLEAWRTRTAAGVAA